jgi:hypothetical protein
LRLFTVPAWRRVAGLAGVDGAASEGGATGACPAEVSAAIEAARAVARSESAVFRLDFRQVFGSAFRVFGNMATGPF